MLLAALLAIATARTCESTGAWFADPLFPTHQFLVFYCDSALTKPALRVDKDTAYDLLPIPSGPATTSLIFARGSIAPDNCSETLRSVPEFDVYAARVVDGDVEVPVAPLTPGLDARPDDYPAFFETASRAIPNNTNHVDVALFLVCSRCSGRSGAA